MNRISFSPVSTDTTIWRYMSFTKLIALLSQEGLYFSRCDTFGDPFEGALGRTEDRESLFSVFDGMAIAEGADRSEFKGEDDNPPDKGHTHHIHIPDDIFEWMLKEAGGDKKAVAKNIAEAIRTDMKNTLSETFRKEFKSIFISCWHLSAHESEAMWRLYSKDTTEGLALQSTIGQLESSLPHDRLFSIRSVQYDDDYVWGPTEEPLTRFFVKRKTFEHEKELRVVVQDMKAGVEGLKGIYIPVRVSTLIQSIVISPYAPDWMITVVTDTLKKFGIEARAHLSNMGAEPFHY